MRNSRSYKITGMIVCLLSTVLFMFPLAIMVVRSFSKGGPANYAKVFDKYNLLLNFRTSVIVVGALADHRGNRRILCGICLFKVGI